MDNSPAKIAMTSPVKMNESQNFFSMSFSMPSEYKIEELPEPIDKRIFFERVPETIIASLRYTWFESNERNQTKANELREWLKNQNNYIASEGFSYAGYNPPWTLPFLRLNEVHIILEKI